MKRILMLFVLMLSGCLADFEEASLEDMRTAPKHIDAWYKCRMSNNMTSLQEELHAQSVGDEIRGKPVELTGRVVNISSDSTVSLKPVKEIASTVVFVHNLETIDAVFINNDDILIVYGEYTGCLSFYHSAQVKAWNIKRVSRTMADQLWENY